MIRALLVAMTLLACTPTERITPADARAAALRMDVALDRAVDEHRQGHPELARQAWRDAHQAWDQGLSAGLATTVDEQSLLRLELHLGRIRAALDDPKGDPAERVLTFEQALAKPLSRLPGGQTPPLAP